MREKLMRTSFKKVCSIAVIFAFLAFSLVQIPQAHATETSTQAKLQSFLTNVLGIDLTRYTVTQSGYGASYPLKYGGLVEEEVVSYTFSNNNGNEFAADPCFFDNGILTACDFNSIQGSILYAQSPSASILDQAKSILQSYQAYASQNYAIDTSYVQQAQGMLSNVQGFSSSSMLSGNMQLTTSQSSYLNVTTTTIQWIYTENGTAMPRKSITLGFLNGRLRDFEDTYGLYRVGCLSKISRQEAVDLGFAAAENYNVSLVWFNSTTGNPYVTYEKPDWSNATYEVSLSMLPGDEWMGAEITPAPGFNSSLPLTQPVYPSNVTRDPLALYPEWQMVFYFSKPIGNTVGMQVGVWGDSKEIVYCSEYGYLGASTPSGSSTSLPSASNQPSGSYASPLPSPPTSSAQPAGPAAASPGSTPQAGAGQQTGSPGSALPSEYGYAAVSALVAAIAIGSYLIIRRRR
jgi:hypothetical protein